MNCAVFWGFCLQLLSLAWAKIHADLSRDSALTPASDVGGFLGFLFFFILLGTFFPAASIARLLSKSKIIRS